jgi:hypothetical protein
MPPALRRRHATHCTKVFVAGANTIPAPAPKVAREPAPKSGPQAPSFLMPSADASAPGPRGRPTGTLPASERVRCGCGGEYSEFLICDMDGPETKASGCLFGSKEARLW